MARHTRKHKRHHGGDEYDSYAVNNTDAAMVQEQPIEVAEEEEEKGEESTGLWGKLTSMFGGKRGRKHSRRHSRSHRRKHKRSHRHKRKHTRKH